MWLQNMGVCCVSSRQHQSVHIESPNQIACSKHGQHVSCSTALLWAGCGTLHTQLLLSEQKNITMCGLCLFQGICAACLLPHALLLGGLLLEVVLGSQ